MTTPCRLFGLVLTAGLTVLAGAQVPQLINYQGRVAVGSVNFDGSGQFKFALVDAAGSTSYWSNDGTSTAGSEPTAAVSLTVTKGLYAVLLGDATLINMTVVPATVFSHADVRLRVWFNDGSHGSQRLTPDQRIAAVGYAMVAGNVADGAITSAKLAPNLTLSGNTQGSFSGNGSGLTSVQVEYSDIMGVPPVTVPNTTVVPGTYTLPTLTVDATGRLTAAASGGANQFIANLSALSPNPQTGSFCLYGDSRIIGTLRASVQVDSNTAAAAPANTGTLRWDSSWYQLQYSDGNSWRQVATPYSISGTIANGGTLVSAATFSAPPVVNVWVDTGSSYSNVTGNALYPISCGKSAPIAVTVTNNSGSSKAITIVAVRQ